MTSKAYLWGQIYGVIHNALPTGLSPGAKLNCSSLPGQYFGHYVALAELHRRPELERALEALAGELSPEDLTSRPLNVEEQSLWHLGFLHRATSGDPAAHVQ